ncbi:unnamed protein product [Symbiodinium natans]|uniref:Succinylglutamate desuccinylase/Aspartoacylase catalytic domain-containing protein n=1 Tax=Symbiodinium natans TaxID=878477 RepID=A0A812NFN6_9DINO|nr:unnamed protein product [Symbiodinium natans]
MAARWISKLPALTAGRRSFSAVALREIAPSVWRLGEGRPRVAVLGGVHGNELSGVEVVQRLLSDFRHMTPDLQISGEITLAIGNPPAVSRGVRFLHQDLNRCFCEALGGDATPGEELARAKVLMPMLRDLDVLLDLHATNKPSTPFARLPGPVEGRKERFASAERLFLRALPCHTVLWDPNKLIAGGAMSDEYASQHAPFEACQRSGRQIHPAHICYESGLASDKSSAAAIYSAVQTCFAELGIVAHPDGKASVEDEGGRQWEHFEITNVYKLDSRGFEWMNGYGTHNFQVVPPETAFGRRLEPLEELVSPIGHESYIVFPKGEALRSPGWPVGWLARKLSPEEV